MIVIAAKAVFGRLALSLAPALALVGVQRSPKRIIVKCVWTQLTLELSRSIHPAQSRFFEWESGKRLFALTLQLIVILTLIRNETCVSESVSRQEGGQAAPTMRVQARDLGVRIAALVVPAAKLRQLPHSGGLAVR